MEAHEKEGEHGEVELKKRLSIMIAIAIPKKTHQAPYLCHPQNHSSTFSRAQPDTNTCSTLRLPVFQVSMTMEKGGRRVGGGEENGEG